jgi:hypothetical protein
MSSSTSDASTQTDELTSGPGRIEIIGPATALTPGDFTDLDREYNLPATITTTAETPRQVEFQWVFYKTLDSMRLDWGDLIGYEFNYKREAKPEVKEVCKQLLRLRAEEFKLKLKQFFTETEEFLNNL